MNVRGGWLLGCLAIGVAVARCGGDSEGGGGPKPEAGTGGDAGEATSGGSGAVGTGGTAGSAGRGGTSAGGASGDAGAAGDGGASGDGGVPSGGAGDGGAPDTGGQGGSATCAPEVGSGSRVTLAQATATFSQTLAFDFSVAHLVDGITDDQLGWAIARDTSSTIGPETAALETATNTPVFPGGTRLTFVLTQNFTMTGDHALGRFRISVTTADRTMFADGNVGTATPGSVGADAIWSPLTPTSACALGGVGLTTLGDSSLLADVHHQAPMTYVVVAETSVTGITGVRLEALEDASLPFGGPGLQALNGNFVLSEFEMYAEAR